MVALLAASTAGANNFQKWQIDGVDAGTDPYIPSLTMSANHTLTAVYVAAPPVVRTLTVASVNPSSGATINRVFHTGTSVTLLAPTTAGGNNFVKWTRNGVD